MLNLSSMMEILVQRISNEIIRGDESEFEKH